ncbi:MAG TPA: hypothetical protein PK054_08360 [Anaerohalosphaeraceae bacterium]|nr:hypothetical protein [Anaerohalosphaeraceae bacterium]HOL88686.1 hypothetical protein [Anaerohalosphaeraceae bacterium]HPP56581.1 hypothetical protein [Anaerohalosphaeraceae bacterium]
MYCSIIKKQINRSLDEKTPLSAGAVRHLERCPSCRLYYESLLQVEAKLRREMPDQPVADTSALEGKILSKIRSESQTVLVQPQTHRLLRPLTAAAAVLLLAALFGLLRHLNRPAPHPNIPEEINPFQRALTADLYTIQNQLLGDSLQQPFEIEIDNLAKDMQTAVRFVSACLPHPPSEAELP